MIERVGELTYEQWVELEAGEHDPFGVEHDPTVWREKLHHVTLRDTAGRLIASAGLVAAQVEAGGETFVVAGVGSVIVTRSERGHGRLRPVLEDALAWAATLGPERAMLWCMQPNVALYQHFGFASITAPVVVDQPGGAKQLPFSAMWRPLQAGVTWPEGDVRVLGLPF